MEERNSMNEIVKLMHQIGRAMEMSRDKQAKINEINENLMKETKPMMVERMKEGVKVIEQDKKEFDDMTKNSLINAKKDVLSLKESTEKEYQEKLVETAKKHSALEAKLKRIEDKLKNERSKGLPDDKIEQVEIAAQKAIDATNSEINNINNEMKDFQNKHFTKRSKLVEFENSLQGYAMELGFENELASVKPEEVKPEEIKPEEEFAKEGKKPEITQEGTNPEPTQEETEPEETKPGTTEKTFEEAFGEPFEEPFEEPYSKTADQDTESKPQEQNEANKYDHKKVLSIEVKDHKYYVTYENKKDGVYNKEMAEIKRLGLFKNLNEKIKLISNRNEYGIDLRTALKADSNVLSILNDETLKKDYKEMYLKALDGSSTLPFEIKYDKDNRYAKALQEGQKKLELKAGSANTIVRNLDEKFGPGFDQRNSIVNIISEAIHGENNNGENIVQSESDKDMNESTQPSNDSKDDGRE